MSVTSPQPWDLLGFVRQIAPAGGGAAPGRLRRLVPVLTLVAGAIAVALVVSHGRDFADALRDALRASWGLVVAGGLLEVASVAGYVLLLRRLRREPAAALARLLRHRPGPERPSPGSCRPPASVVPP